MTHTFGLRVENLSPEVGRIYHLDTLYVGHVETESEFTLALHQFEQVVAAVEQLEALVQILNKNKMITKCQKH